MAQSYVEKLVEFVTVPRSIHKADAVGLVSAFGSVRAAVNARPEEVGGVAGWGEMKVRRWCEGVRDPFRVRRAGKREIGGRERTLETEASLRREETTTSAVVADDDNEGDLFGDAETEESTTRPAKNKNKSDTAIPNTPARTPIPPTNPNSNSNPNPNPNPNIRPPKRPAPSSRTESDINLDLSHPSFNEEEDEADDEEALLAQSPPPQSSLKGAPTSTSTYTSTKDDLELNEGMMAALAKLREG